MYPTCDVERDLYAAYVRHLRLLDEKSLDEAALFFRAALVHTPKGSWSGAAEALDRFSPVVRDQSARSKHLLSTYDIALSSDATSARTFSYVLVLGQLDTKVVAIQTSPCEDHFQLQGSAWVLTAREELDAGHLIRT